jgi:hypothetical protein
MKDDLPVPQRTFPASVHESLAELRALSKAVRSHHEWQASGRRATPEEIALSEQLRQPQHCVAHSSRTGLACEKTRIQGGTTCSRHGGQLPRVKRRAERRLAAAVMPVIDSMVTIATSSTNHAAAVKAGSDLLDRAGIGELVEAKVRSSQRESGGSRIEVRIGFLQQLGTGEATAITVPVTPTIGRADD